MKKLWNKIIDKLFGKRCKCAEKKPKKNYAPLECTTCGKIDWQG